MGFHCPRGDGLCGQDAAVPVEHRGAASVDPKDALAQPPLGIHESDMPPAETSTTVRSKRRSMSCRTGAVTGCMSVPRARMAAMARNGTTAAARVAARTTASASAASQSMADASFGVGTPRRTPMVNGTAFLGGSALARFGLTAFGAGFGLRGVEWKAMASTSSDGLSGFSSVYLSLSSSRSDMMGSFRIRRPHASSTTHGRTPDGRNGGTRTRGLAAPSRARCQLRHIPKPSPSSPGAEAPMGQKGGWRRRTPIRTRTGIDGFGDRRAADCTIDAKEGVHRAMRAAARSSGRKTRSTPPKSPEPDSNRRPAAYEAAALPLGHRGLDGPSHRFFQCMMRVCPHGCLVRRATGGTVWWSRRDSNPRPSRCERDALPLRHGPMPAPAYARAGWKRSHSGGGVTPLVPSAGFEPATPTLGGWRSFR